MIKKIYAEWLLYGVFHNGFFASYEDFIKETFNPDIEIICIKESDHAGNFKRTFEQCEIFPDRRTAH